MKSKMQELAKEIARLALALRDRVLVLYDSESQDGPLHSLYQHFADKMGPNLSLKDFADEYAQSVTHGLFTARITRGDRISKDFIDNLLKQIEISVPNLNLEEMGLTDMIKSLEQRNIEASVREFRRQKKGEDPVIHFYEAFLKEYDPVKRIKRGVFYTPNSVVSFIVRSVDELLQAEFESPSGLAENARKILILDPATGTGTFLKEIIDKIKRKFDEKNKGLDSDEMKKQWIEQFHEYLLRQLFGFEVMVTPHAIAQLKIGMGLTESGLSFSPDEQLGIYLTNALDGSIGEDETLDPDLKRLISGIGHARLGKERPILVVVGNPPYSVSSQNSSPYIELLMEDYKRDVKTEKNIQPLSDDYVKFIRYGHHLIDRNEAGIMAFITNNSYLSGLIHRGMRSKLLETFNKIFILNLHGNSRIGEKCPDGSKDENVFDIMQGVAIAFFLRNKEKSGLGKIYYSDVYGLRKEKYEFLNNNSFSTIKWKELTPSQPHFFFVEKDFSMQAEYETFWSITDIFPKFSSSVKTHRDHFVIGFTKEEIIQRLEEFTSEISDKEIKEKLNLRDTRDWKLSTARNQARKANLEEYLRSYAYRPFDSRYICYLPALLERGCDRWALMRNFFEENVGLETTRLLNRKAETFCHAFVNNQIIDMGFLSSKTSESTYTFPLYLYAGEGEQFKKPNINPKLIKQLKRTFDLDISPEEIFHFIYALLFSNTFRIRYFELLKIDYPRVPVPADHELFKGLGELGKQLVETHLLKSKEVGISQVRFQGSGECRVGTVKYDKTSKRVHLNNNHFFSNIEEAVWNYRIGGYQICSKWLKERKNRILSNEEIEVFQKIHSCIKRTFQLVEKIDALIETKGGWPLKHTMFLNGK